MRKKGWIWGAGAPRLAGRIGTPDRVYVLARAKEGIAVAAGTQGLRIVSLW